MDKWNDKTKTVIINCSTVDDYVEAVQEWNYISPINDRGERDGECELCDTPIRYEYKIINEKNKTKLIVGCECIKRFVEEGKHKRKEEILESLRSAKKEFERLQVSILLQELKEKDKWFGSKDDKGTFIADSFAKDYRKNRYFSPKQLVTVAKGLKRIKNEEAVEFLSTNIRKSRNKDQLLTLKKEEYELIQTALSTSQKQQYFNR